MTDSPDPIQDFWDDLLSGEPRRVREAFNALDAETQDAVRNHLERMVNEEGWHPLQVTSAQAALDVIYLNDITS